MKWIFGPLPESSGANSTTTPGQLATRSYKASNPARSATATVRDECRGIFRPLANDAPPQAIAEEAAGALEISDAQTDVIDAACGGCGVLCHGLLLWCADDIMVCSTTS